MNACENQNDVSSKKGLFFKFDIYFFSIKCCVLSIKLGMPKSECNDQHIQDIFCAQSFIYVF